MTWTLQSFVANSLPTIKAVWLNAVDTLCSQMDGIFGTASTPTTARAALGLKTVQTGTTKILAVPTDYATIQAAVTEAQSWRIQENAYLRITVADGTYTLTAGINFNHPDGANNKFQIVGNTTTPANCVIAVTYAGALTFDCFTVTSGSWLYVDGFKFLKSAKALAIDNTTALLASIDSTIVCGTNILVDNWYYGIAARDHSVVYCPSVDVDNAGDVGIWAYRHSYVYADGATSNNATDVANNLGFGFQAEYGSTLVCSNGSATGCRVAGAAALAGSMVDAAAMTSSSNTGSGLFTNGNSVIYASGATTSSNGAWGCDTRDTSLITPVPTTNAGNTNGKYSWAPRTVLNSAAYTLVDTDNTLVIDRAAGSCTITLSAASGYPGRKLNIMTIQAQTVVSNSSDVVPKTGGAAGTAILPATDGAWCFLESDGANWLITASGV